ncbi:carcinoembryonic antigen-related cell adhesion molecule 5-like [Echeneis naucrates]|uniref:carcinoembryonic antigen-related cell adhesion molecule 5-like n=1 Tax=Echeneis naucrates TaxID=173247 RepID=UPI001113C247|nr:carcinoembryonic antigen-related cell adhesion molecule 5-like [Echeneis naucrates]
MGHNPLIYRVKLQHVGRELGNKQQAHICPPPLLHIRASPSWAPLVQFDEVINRTLITWIYVLKDGKEENIAIFVPGLLPSYPDSTLQGRVSFLPSPPNITRPSIQIRDLRMTDEGNYICQFATFPGGNQQNTTSLSILEPVGRVILTASSRDLVEFSSVRLSCSVSSGSSVSFFWLNGSSEVTASDRVQLTDGNANLTIVNVTRYDRGPYKCDAFNAVSNGSSDLLLLSISFGPENTLLTKSPSQENYLEGSNIRLSCSAVSNPAALFYWLLNGSLLSDTGPEFRLINVQMNQSGNYSCQAFNNQTMINQTSQPSFISVLKPVGRVILTASSRDLVEFSSVRLSCSVSSGSSVSFLWLNSSSEVTASDRVQLTDGNANLTIVSVTRYDRGPYKCDAFNAVSNGSSDPLLLSISFGPENTLLTKSPSQENYLEGSNITLSCSAVSNPAALFYWLLNGSLLSDTGPEFRLINVQMSQSGDYSCQAFNNQTMIIQTSQPSFISVLKPVGRVILTASSRDLVEFSSVRLSCSVSSGSSVSFFWLNGSSEVTASDRVQLTDGNANLTIVNVTRYDRGPYKCDAFNALSNGSSDPLLLSISSSLTSVVQQQIQGMGHNPLIYRVKLQHAGRELGNKQQAHTCPPPLLHIRASPSWAPLMARHGSRLTLQIAWLYVQKAGTEINIAIFAPGRPPSYPDSPLQGRVSFLPSPPNITSPSIQIRDLRMTDEGNYICRCSIFPEGSRQNTTSLFILEPVGRVILTASSRDLVEFSSVRLSCSVSSGSSVSFLWLNSSSEVTASDRVQLTDGNANLTIVSVTRYDRGPYKCDAFNALSHGSSDPLLLSISCELLTCMLHLYSDNICML